MAKDNKNNNFVKMDPGSRKFPSKMNIKENDQNTEHSALGRYLKMLREKNDYSQEELADKLSIKRQAYSHYETGRVRPPADKLFILSEIYGLDIRKMLDVYTHSDDKNIDIVKMVNESSKRTINNIQDFKEVYEAVTNDSIAYNDFLKYMQDNKDNHKLDLDELELIFYYKNCNDADKLVIKTILQRMYKAAIN
ncbi:MAG: helix-turn-helix domain-containing protein [Butyrivibrio sp.]|nr:helix-turn-helix domain-containing protein [Butyrivibrio sp.]